jgi:hypothetical protein
MARKLQSASAVVEEGRMIEKVKRLTRESSDIRAGAALSLALGGNVRANAGILLPPGSG